MKYGFLGARKGGGDTHLKLTWDESQAVCRKKGGENPNEPGGRDQRKLQDFMAKNGVLFCLWARRKKVSARGLWDDEKENEPTRNEGIRKGGRLRLSRLNLDRTA